MNVDDRNTKIAELFAQLTILMTAQSTVEVSVARPMPSRVLLTVEEAAKQLGVGKTKAYELVRSGVLASVQIGRLRRIHIDAINAYADHLVAEQGNGQTAA